MCVTASEIKIINTMDLVIFPLIIQFDKALFVLEGQFRLRGRLPQWFKVWLF